ncbi:hypothetical protein CYR40_02200 [Chimaeribacter arupi]|uniref:Uncharacterized protein n=2 Tax=Yersiniaceae TaxID=1903411 RepID=A0A2N5EPQ6_9GAMM|nr:MULTISPECIES: hypothetical protein [Yersiniaceae]MBS0970214.1 hypothetical protein [Nissabacter archeti]MDV5140536.1 hypothetical protein [Chimaeribacter arupi]PLR38993.1 hypothetical protein CYR23_02780 [Chimaeribacter arupi]PLR49906.1 hypothetical protein CYR40_02200 [Chimaeribacter arupi]PLR51407.1 hypothetical protein CYR34_06910 [Chimaeribacter arupi]
MIKTVYLDNVVYQLEADELLTACEQGSYAIFGEAEGWWAVRIDAQGAYALSPDPADDRAAALGIITRHLHH